MIIFQLSLPGLRRRRMWIKDLLDWSLVPAEINGLRRRGYKRHRDSKERREGKMKMKGVMRRREGGEMMERWSRQRSLFSL